MQSRGSVATTIRLSVILASGAAATMSLARECLDPLYYGPEGRAVMQFYGDAASATLRGSGVIETASPRHIFRFSISDDKIEFTGVRGAVSAVVRKDVHVRTGAILYILTPDLQKTYDDVTKGSSLEALRGIRFEDTWKFIACTGRK